MALSTQFTRNMMNSEMLEMTKKMTVGVVDYEKCKICKNGAAPSRFSSQAAPDRIAALCNRTCMCGLEAASRIGNVFENPFRTSDAWAIDEKGAYCEPSSAEDIQGGVFLPGKK